MGIYPFCNRSIIFLIPIFILCIINAFDKQKIVIWDILGDIPVIYFMLMMIFYGIRIEEIRNLITDTTMNETVKKNYEFIESLNAEDEIILSNEGLCSYCLNNKNILIIIEKNHKGEIVYFDKRDNKYKKVSSVTDLVKDKNKVCYVYPEHEFFTPDNNSSFYHELKSINYKETYITKSDEYSNLFLYSILEK